MSLCKGSYTAPQGAGARAECSVCQALVPTFEYEAKDLGGGLVTSVPKGKHLMPHQDSWSEYAVEGALGNTHYAVLTFSGDPAGEHDDPDLYGTGPSLTLIASGPEQFCWDSLARWTAAHPLRQWEEAEVLARHPSVVRLPEVQT